MPEEQWVDRGVRRRAVEAAVWAMPAVNFEIMPSVMSPKGTSEFVYWPQADRHAHPVRHPVWEALDRVVQVEPWLPRDRAFAEMLQWIGIRKGLPFSPDAHHVALLESAVQEAHAWIRDVYEHEPPFYEGRQWFFPAGRDFTEGQHDNFTNGDVYPYTDRGVTYHMAFIGIKRLGIGQFYLVTARDSAGNLLRSDATYRTGPLPRDSPGRTAAGPADRGPPSARRHAHPRGPAPRRPRASAGRRRRPTRRRRPRHRRPERRKPADRAPARRRRIGGAGSATAPMLHAFRDACPAVELRVQRLHADRAVQAVLDGSVDLALLHGPVHDQRITVSPLFTEPRIVALSPADARADAPHLNAADLLDLPALARRERVREDWEGFFTLVPERDGEQPERVGDPTASLEELLYTIGLRRLFLTMPAHLQHTYPGHIYGVRYLPVPDLPFVTFGIAARRPESPVVAGFRMLATSVIAARAEPENAPP